VTQPNDTRVWIDVGSLADFKEGESRAVYVDRQAIGIVRWRGRVFAARGICPHQLGPLCEGLVRSKLRSVGSSGVLELDRESPVIVCPWHGWEFDLATGRMIAEGSLRIRTYDVRVHGSRVVMDIGRGRRE
jgi:nitrite reductase (NADH) small subunit